MLIDVQGLTVTTDSANALHSINQFIDQSLAYGKDAEVAILASLAADPTCAIAHAYAAAYYLSQEHSIARKQAVSHVKAAQQFAPNATHREQLYIEAIAAWSGHAIDRAIALHEQLADQFPQDIISVQQGQYHYFYRGEKERLLTIAERVLPANPNHHYLYGMVTFGLEQCHQLTAAEQMAHRAITLNRHDPWAHHAIAHIMDTQGRLDEGIAWMEQFADTWETCNSMLYTHNWWHIALFYVACGDQQTALYLYDAHVWGRARKATPKDQVGAIALLVQLELKGVNVGDRWQQVTGYLYPRLHEHALAFQDLHYIYALARAEKTEWLQEMMDSLSTHSQCLSVSSHHIWQSVVLPTARGLIAHSQQNWTEAIALLKPVLPHLWQLGGSHAQHKLFKHIYRHAHAQIELSNRRLIARHLSYAVSPVTLYPASKAV